jgi:HEAT repeat protein
MVSNVHSSDTNYSDTELIEIFKKSVFWVNPPDVAQENRTRLIDLGPEILPALLPLMEKEFLMQQYGLQDIIYGILKRYESTDNEVLKTELTATKKEIAGFLRDHLQAYSYEGLRWVIRWLAELNVDPELDIPVIIKHINHPYWRVRSAVANSLGLLESNLGSGYVIQLMQDPVEEVRSQAAVAAGRIKDPVLINPLCELLEDPLFPARMNAADSLVNIALNGYQHDIEKRMIQLLTAELPKVKHLAMEIIGRAGTKNALNYIEPFFSSGDRIMRGFAVEAAGAIGTVTIREHLEELLENEQDYFVRGKLKRVLGDSFGNRNMLFPHDHEK